jgi:hypothetical protein
MCDGMGWFSKNDFKRMLLLYDRIMYLVPSRTVEFRDVDGRSSYIPIPKKRQEMGFQFQHYEPDDATAEALIHSAEIDATRTTFASIIATIPQAERIYTWRITNADAAGISGFDRQVLELINTEVWRDKTEVERELRDAWASFFKSSVKSAVAGGVALGITPFLSLGGLSMASVLAGVAAAAPWATSELFSFLERRKKVEQHGMYYLMNFKS